jgi:hypothetical protein
MELITERTNLLLGLILPVLVLYLFGRLFRIIEEEYPEVFESLGKPMVLLQALNPHLEWKSFIFVFFPGEIKKGSQSHRYIWFIRMIIFIWLVLVLTYSYELYTKI